MNPILLDSPICRATFHVTTCSSNCPQTGILTGHEDTGVLHSPGLTWTIASTEHTKIGDRGIQKERRSPDFLRSQNHPPPQQQTTTRPHTTLDSSHSPPSSTDTFFEQYPNRQTPTTLLLHSATPSAIPVLVTTDIFPINPSLIQVIRTHLNNVSLHVETLLLVRRHLRLRRSIM